VRPLVLLLLAALAFGDTVHLKGGKRLVGRIADDGDPVVLNPFNSIVPGMTWGVEKVPKDRVRKLERTLPTPEHEYQARLAEAKTAQDCLDLAAWCDERKLRDQREWALERALRLDPDSEARKLLGSRAPKGRWPEQVELARKILAGEGSRPGPDFPFDELYLQRARRSLGQPKGEQKDRPVALRADKLESGARYTLFVPDDYDPLRPTPLVIGLHGGGAGGADGQLVVGDGWQAMAFYRGECGKRGWICACPTAVRAGWGGQKNDALVDAVLEEVAALYNVDENRVYLVGHSMGGGGTWVQGTRAPERWAAIAPAASYGPRGIDGLLKSRTGLYVYHSDDDPRTPVAPIRAAMQPLAGSGEDFVYTELPGRGHAFPREVIADIFDYFAVHTLARGRGKPTVRPQSSFARKLSRDERKYLPELPELDGTGEAAEGTLGELLRRLKTGGGVAAQAVPELAASKDDKTGRAVARIMTKSGTESDVRAYCARILGERKEEPEALAKLLGMETDASALLAALAALDEIGDAESGRAVVRFLGRRRAYLEQRATSGRVDHSDWTTIVPPLARACELLGRLKPKGAAAAIVQDVLEGVLLSDIRVVYDRQNQNPLPVGQALASAACTALRRLADPATRPALEKLRARAKGATGADVRALDGPGAEMGGWARDPRVAADVAQALSEIPTGG